MSKITLFTNVGTNFYELNAMADYYIKKYEFFVHWCDLTKELQMPKTSKILRVRILRGQIMYLMYVDLKLN